MFLKSLELHGFKSFPNRTVLTFERGTTVIVGPNGSGKSNISDAMRWVLGETSYKSIRGSGRADVIFGGTAERRPMGFAEVTVTFDNTDPDNRLDSPFDEVSVTRRVYRNGNSEYLINKEPSKLRSIVDLFMNTGIGREGYSIIGQGKVTEIISKKSDERRNIFEEAAGIAKFRHRKEETERNLLNTQDNLDRVKDILSELEKQVGPLEQKAEKAKKGLAVYEEKKRADVALWLFDTQKIRDDIAEADKNWKLSAHELEILDSVIADLEAQSDHLYQKAQSNKLLSEQLYNQIRETTDKLRKLDSAMSISDTEFIHSNRMIEDSRTRIEEIEKTEENLGGDRAGFERKIEEQNKELAGMSDERLEYLAESDRLHKQVEQLRNEVDGVLADLTAEGNHANDLKVRINVLQSEQLSGDTKAEDLRASIAQYEAESKSLEEAAAKCEENASGYKAKIAEKEDVIRNAVAAIEKLNGEREDTRNDLNELQLQKDTLTQRADVLQRMTEQFEGYAGSVKFVMKSYRDGQIPGTIYGPLSSLIHVEQNCVVALDTALGSSLQNIVVDNEETAKASMNALKRANAGRATFYPITAIRPMSETDEVRQAADMPGFIGRADRLVGCEDKFRSIVEWLLIRTVVFDNIDNAAAAAKKLRYRVKMVTLDGQLINAGGSFTGGSMKNDSGILSRQTKIQELREEAEKISERITQEKEVLSEIEGDLRDRITEQKNAEQDKELLLTLSRTQFAALDTANANLTANRNVLEKLHFDLQNLLGERSAGEEKLRDLEDEYSAACERMESLKSYREKKASEMGILDERSDELSQKANEIFIQITRLKGETDTSRQMIATVDARISELAAEKQSEMDKIAELESKRDRLDRSRSDQKNERDELEELTRSLTEKRNEMEQGSDEFEKARNEIATRLKEKNAGRDVVHENALRNENTLNNLKEKQDKMGSVLWDDYELTYEQAVDLQYPPVTQENRAEFAEIQTSCKNKLRNLGAWDITDIEKYAEVKTRYDALNSQVTDLTRSYEEMTDIIARLEAEMRDGFTKAFNEISKHFGVTFRELFGGGTASLSLTEPDDVLTSGIEINAQPPGKAVGSMSLLSGGEQAFVAIALLFAILKVNPSPFCILDEIEAALDEVNVFRFGEYVRRMSGDTQFILITHRRGTMEVGNRLYGVTMPQRGISQAIELNVNEIEGANKEVLDGVL